MFPLIVLGAAVIGGVAATALRDTPKLDSPRPSLKSADIPQISASPQSYLVTPVP